MLILFVSVCNTFSTLTFVFQLLTSFFFFLRRSIFRFHKFCNFRALFSFLCLVFLAKCNPYIGFLKAWYRKLLIYVDPPDVRQCLDDIQPADYDSTLTVKCYAPGNPDPTVMCQLWDENSDILRSLGNCCYSLHISCHKALP